MSFKDKIFKNQSPWGSPPGDGGRPSDGNGSGTRQDPPNLDDIIKNIQKCVESCRLAVWFCEKFLNEYKNSEIYHMVLE